MGTLTRTRKLVAGLGMACMAGGGLMVVGPSAGASHSPVTSAAPAPVVRGGNQTCPAGDFDIRFDPSPESGTASETEVVEFSTGDETVTITYTTELVNGVQHYYWTSTHVISQVIVKQGNDSAVFTYDPPWKTGTAYVALSSGSTASRVESSHISFCITTTQTTTTTESTTTTSTTSTTTTSTTAPTTTTTSTTAPTTTTTSTTVAPTTTTSTTVTVEGTGVENTTTTSTTEAVSPTTEDNTPTTEQQAAPATVQRQAEVKGDVVTRTLPRTGSETSSMAGVGAFMVLLGAALVVGSSRRRGEVS